MVNITRVGTVAWGLILLASAVWSQTDPVESFLDTVDVRVVNIETVVTDGRGNRVPDLGPDDFRLLVNGREVEIDYFSEIRDGRALAPGNAQTVAAVLPDPDSPVPDTIPTNYLVFVEDVFPRGAHRNLVLKNLADQIDTLGPADQMSIMAFDGRRLDALSGWTQEPEKLRQALTAAGKRPAFGAFRDQERRNFAGGTLGTTEFTTRMPSSQAIGYATLLESQLRSVIGAASTAIRVAGRPDGRKVMLLLSGGWPFEILPPGQLHAASVSASGSDGQWNGNLWTGIPRLDTFNSHLLFARGRELYQLLTDTANRLSYTLYPVDVPGVVWTGRDVNSENLGSSRNRADGALRADRQSRDEGTLALLANQTGGRALLNDLRLEALGRAIEDTRSYYWLGFQVDSNGNDQRHRVRVETRQKGLRVRARRNYIDLSRQSEVAMTTEAALYLQESDDFGLAVTVGPTRESRRGQVEVSLELSIPVDELTLVPVSQGWAAVLDISLLVRDDRANVSDLETIPVNLLAKTEPQPGARTLYELWVTLADQSTDLAVTIRDKASENTLTTFTRIDL